MNIKAFSVFLLFTKVDTVLSQICTDSTLLFKLDGEAHSCETHVQNNSTFCNLGGEISGNVTTHCPASCGLSDCTGIESEMRFSVLLEQPFGSGNFVNKWKQCDWLGIQNTCNRCAKEGVKETCPVSCLLGCPPSPVPSVVPSALPSSTPTDVSSDVPSAKPTAGNATPPPTPAPITPAPTISSKPSSMPSDVHTHSPSSGPTLPSNCTDSPLSFRYKRKKYDCDLVKNENPAGLCLETDQDIASHCPLSCGQFDCTNEESKMYFQVLLQNKQGKHVRKWKKCAWVLKQNCNNRCARNGIAETCPDSCSKC